jgi:hypothetical protein
MTRAGLLVGAMVLLTGCAAANGVETATTQSDLRQALAVELPGYHSVDGPEITAVCDPPPSGGETPQLPADLGRPVSAFFARAESTVEAYGWALEDEAAARTVVDDVIDAAGDCEHEVPVDPAGTDVQTTEPWDDAGWTGLRIHREVTSGAEELVERRLVRLGDVVLLVVLRSDVLGDEQLDALDTLLQDVGTALR